jgi:uncharacterized protein YecE (DUF72 family)
MAIRIGSCSWTEKSLIQSKEFYPKGVSTPEKRLRYYSSTFDVVEVDSSYYAIPLEKTVSQWAERTPSGFTFHVKAYASLTGHSTDLKSVPPEVRDMLSTEDLKKDRVTLKEREPLEATFRLFQEALRPLEEAKKIGIVVFQYPPYFVYKPQNLEYILFCKDMLKGFRVGIEFRHGSWLTENKRKEVFEFLRKNGLVYIAADEPQFGTMATVPLVLEATSDIACVRLHGRNRENWFKRGETSERYRYLYSRDELKPVAAPITELSKKARVLYVMFNNCYGSFAIRNSLDMKQILEEQGTSQY